MLSRGSSGGTRRWRRYGSLRRRAAVHRQRKSKEGAAARRRPRTDKVSGTAGIGGGRLRGHKRGVRRKDAKGAGRRAGAGVGGNGRPSRRIRRDRCPISACRAAHCSRRVAYRSPAERPPAGDRRRLRRRARGMWDGRGERRRGGGRPCSPPRTDEGGCVTGQGGAREGWGSAVRHDMTPVNSHVLDEGVNTPTVARLFEKLGSLPPIVGPEPKQYGPQLRQCAIGQQRPSNRGLRPCNRGLRPCDWARTARLRARLAIAVRVLGDGTALRRCARDAPLHSLNRNFSP